jgi:hypothetical protein
MIEYTIGMNMNTVSVYKGIENRLESTLHYFMQPKAKTPMNKYPQKKKVLVANDYHYFHKPQKDLAMSFKREYRGRSLW